MLNVLSFILVIVFQGFNFLILSVYLICPIFLEDFSVNEKLNEVLQSLSFLWCIQESKLHTFTSWFVSTRTKLRCPLLWHTSSWKFIIKSSDSSNSAASNIIIDIYFHSVSSNMTEHILNTKDSLNSLAFSWRYEKEIEACENGWRKIRSPMTRRTTIFTNIVLRQKGAERFFEKLSDRKFWERTSEKILTRKPAHIVNENFDLSVWRFQNSFAPTRISALFVRYFVNFRR